MRFHSHKLANGLQLIGESSPHALSAAVGFFVRTGSRDETTELSGVSHFLEHMAFKGNDKRDPLEVNRQFDAIGSSPNAYTSQENTAYYASVLPEYLPEVVDLLANLLMPGLKPEDFALEKGVIINEISKYHDEPDSSAADQSQQLYFGKHSLGNSILGSKESITAMTYEQMRDYYRRRYVAPNITVSIAGQFDWDRFIDLVSACCGGWTPTPEPRAHQRDPAEPGGLKVVRRDGVALEYLHMMSSGPDAKSPLRHAADLLGMAIGDSSGSRLYWEVVHEGLGEASFGYQEYEDAGLFCTSLVCEPDNAVSNRDLVLGVLDEVQTDGITAEELEQARNKLLSRLVRSGERTKGRMFALGNAWTYYGCYRSIDDDLRDYEAVTLDHVRQVLERYPLPQVTTLALGPLAELA